MANRMATMQGCGCNGITINNCTEFYAWWATITECALTGVSLGQNSPGACPNCHAALDGDYLLDTSVSQPTPCAVAPGIGTPSYEFPDPKPEICFAGSGFEWTGFVFAPGCNISPAQVEFFLYLAHYYSGSATDCRIIAHRVISLPATSTTLASGTLTALSGSPASDCRTFTGIPYALS